MNTLLFAQYYSISSALCVTNDALYIDIDIDIGEAEETSGIYPILAGQQTPQTNKQIPTFLIPLISPFLFIVALCSREHLEQRSQGDVDSGIPEQVWRLEEQRRGAAWNRAEDGEECSLWSTSHALSATDNAYVNYVFRQLSSTFPSYNQENPWKPRLFRKKNPTTAGHFATKCELPLYPH